MAHFAELDENNVVLRVVVVNDDYEADGENWCNEKLGGKWKQTSYNTTANVHNNGGTPFRKNYAGEGFTYNEALDGFIPPQRFNSWIVDEDTCQWKAPVDMPTDGKFYGWNEEIQEWYLEEVQGIS